MSFPRKLHAMLEAASVNNFEDVVAWQPGGTSFKVVDPKRFADEIMNIHFKQTKYKSFQRQLNTYGFRRFHHGPNKGGYSHRHFVKRSPELCDGIVRRGPVDMSLKDMLEDPNIVLLHAAEDLHRPVMHDRTLSFGSTVSFLDMEAFHHDRSLSMGDGKLGDAEFTAFYEMVYQEDQDGQAPASLEEIVSSENNPNSQNEEEEPNNDEDGHLEKKEHSFPWKLHLMLEHAEKEGYQDVVSWVKEGTAFKVHKSKDFVEKVMPIYFDQTKYESFRRQLNLYGFTRMSRGEDRGTTSHPFLIQGSRHLCGNIFRKAAPS